MRKIAIPILLATLIPAGSASAETERDYLARIAHEIDALAPLIDKAEARADKAARIRFRYDWLRRDLQRIREGVIEHATADQAAPRQYPPLRGDYRR